MKPARELTSIENASKPRTSKRRVRRIYASLILAIVAIGTAAFVDSRPTVRFDSKMPLKDALIIRREAEKADDAETWLAIQEEVLIKQSTEGSLTVWDLLDFIQQTGSIRNGIRTYELTRSARASLHSSKLHSAAESIVDRYRPRIVEAAAKRSAELLRHTGFTPHPSPEILGRDPNSLLAAHYEMQGRVGEAADQRWYAWLAALQQSDFEEFLRVSELVSEFDRDADIRKYLESISDKLPDDLWLVRFVGIAHRHAGQFEKAEPLLARAADAFTDDPEGRFAWAETRLALKMPVDSESIMGPPCRHSIHFETQEAMRLFCRAQLFMKTGDTELALQDAEAAIRLDPRFRNAWSLVAQMSWESGQFVRAKVAESHARALDRVETRLFNAVRLYLERNDPPRTMSAHAEAIARLDLISAMIDADSARPAATLMMADQAWFDRMFFDRTSPELNPSLPDRVFCPRPVPKSIPDALTASK